MKIDRVDEKPRVEEALSTPFAIGETAEEDDWWAFRMLKAEF